LRKAEVLKIIKQGEGINVEFKTNFSTEVIITLNAFANTKGGSVYIGINDSGEITGTQTNKETLQNWLNEIKQKTEPSIIPDSEVIVIRGSTIVKITIKEFPIKPVSVQGRYYKRIRNSNHQLSLSQISDLYLHTFNTSWDYSIDEQHTFEDISIEKIGKTINYLREREHSVKENAIEFLSKSELIRTGSPTKACYLLFMKANSVLTTIELGRFQTETIIKDSNRLQTDLLSEVEEVLSFIKKHISKEIIITGEVQNVEKWEYPLEALRELVLNMIIHRDYSKPSDSIVKIFDDRIEFFNPGLLPENITIRKLLTNDYKSVPRNKLIANICKDLGWIEKYGTGIRRILEYFKQEDLPTPKFKEISGGFQATVYGRGSQKSNLKSNLKSNFKSNLNEESKLNKTEELILNAVSEDKYITRKEIAEKGNMSEGNIKKYIASLTRKKIIKYEGSSKKGNWVILR
jgi:ATP-dependent DNA helicase RecG